MSVGRILLLVFGILALIMAIGLVVGGAGALWANGALTDDEGYFTTETIRIDQDSYAVVTEPTNIDIESWWVWDWGDLATFKVEFAKRCRNACTFLSIVNFFSTLLPPLLPIL